MLLIFHKDKEGQALIPMDKGRQERDRPILKRIGQELDIESDRQQLATPAVQEGTVQSYPAMVRVGCTDERSMVRINTASVLSCVSSMCLIFKAILYVVRIVHINIYKRKKK